MGLKANLGQVDSVACNMNWKAVSPDSGELQPISPDFLGRTDQQR
jgi:hypothetical protein